MTGSGALGRPYLDLWLGQQERAETVRRSLASIGRFRSGLTDVSESHDRYLTEAYRETPKSSVHPAISLRRHLPPPARYLGSILDGDITVSLHSRS